MRCRRSGNMPASSPLEPSHGSPKQICSRSCSRSDRLGFMRSYSQRIAAADQCMWSYTPDKTLLQIMRPAKGGGDRHFLAGRITQGVIAAVGVDLQDAGKVLQM